MAMIFKVEKMNCGGCARKATDAILAVAPAADVKIDLERKIIEVASVEVEDARVAAAITDAGYPATALR